MSLCSSISHFLEAKFCDVPLTDLSVPLVKGSGALRYSYYESFSLCGIVILTWGRSGDLPLAGSVRTQVKYSGFARRLGGEEV
jgi:hypothetical protein